MRDKKEVLRAVLNKKWALVTFVAGLLIPFALSPLISPFVTQAYVETGIDSQRPEVTAHGAYTPTPSTPSTFSGLDWNNSYRYYNFIISNEGNEPAKNVELNLNFPGCVIDYKKSRAPVMTAITSEGPAYGVMTSGGNQSNEILECSKEVFIPALPSDERVIVEFVIQQNFQYLQNKTTVNLNPSRQFSLTYGWEKGSVDYEDSSNGKIIGPNSDKLFAEAFYNYGIWQMNSGLLRSSIDYFDKSLETGHELTKARLKKAEALYGLSVKENTLIYSSLSLNELNKVTNSTNSSRAWHNKGIIYAAYSDYYKNRNMALAKKYRKGAITSFKIALKKNTSYNEARNALSQFQ